MNLLEQVDSAVASLLIMWSLRVVVFLGRPERFFTSALPVLIFRAIFPELQSLKHSFSQQSTPANKPLREEEECLIAIHWNNSSINEKNMRAF